MTHRPDLNKLAKEVFEANKAKGFHEVERSNETLLMLVNTELSKAVEADRKGKRANVGCFNVFNDYNRPVSDAFSFESTIKDTVEDELADAVIRLLDLAGLRGYNVGRFLLYGASVNCNRALSENIFRITAEIAYYKYSLEERINFAIINIEELCKLLSIDLWRHVELKLQYNKTREYKHGKMY